MNNSRYAALVPVLHSLFAIVLNLLAAGQVVLNDDEEFLHLCGDLNQG